MQQPYSRSRAVSTNQQGVCCLQVERWIHASAVISRLRDVATHLQGFDLQVESSGLAPAAGGLQMQNCSVYPCTNSGWLLVEFDSDAHMHSL
jgi:hypothetical protein